MDPTKYRTASGKDCTIRVKPTGKDFGIFSRIKIGGKVVWDSDTFPEGCAEQAKARAVKQLEKL